MLAVFFLFASRPLSLFPSLSLSPPLSFLSLSLSQSLSLLCPSLSLPISVSLSLSRKYSPTLPLSLISSLFTHRPSQALSLSRPRSLCVLLLLIFNLPCLCLCSLISFPFVFSIAVSFLLQIAGRLRPNRFFCPNKQSVCFLVVVPCHLQAPKRFMPA
jgi:hypothetical protein